MKNMLTVAIGLAAKVFENKLDKAGKPYILHCLRVMYNLNTNDQERQIIAVLHDVVEDSDITLEILLEMGFSIRVVTAIDLLSHRDGVPYMDYIKKLATNPDAKETKKADLKDNSDITRLKGLREKDFERVQKYHTAWVYLSD